MSTKFSAFYRYIMLQLPASCGCSPRCKIVDRHVDLLSTSCHVGGCKFSPLSRDTRHLAKDYSSELQACFSVDVRSDVASVHLRRVLSPCEILRRHQGPDVTVCGGCGAVEQ